MTTPRRKHFDYLNSLRLSGDTNMFGAAPFLMRQFDLSSKDALAILQAWVEKFPDHVKDAEKAEKKAEKKAKKEKKEKGIWPFGKGKK